MSVPSNYKYLQQSTNLEDSIKSELEFKEEPLEAVEQLDSQLLTSIQTLQQLYGVQKCENIDSQMTNITDNNMEADNHENLISRNKTEKELYENGNSSTASISDTQEITVFLWTPTSPRKNLDFREKLHSECGDDPEIKLQFKRILNNYLEKGLFECPVCDYSTTLMRFIRKHLLRNFRTDLCTCEECDFRTNWMCEYKQHVIQMSYKDSFKMNSYSAFEYRVTHRQSPTPTPSSNPSNSDISNRLNDDISIQSNSRSLFQPDTDDSIQSDSNATLVQSVNDVSVALANAAEKSKGLGNRIEKAKQKLEQYYISQNHSRTPRVRMNMLSMAEKHKRIRELNNKSSARYREKTKATRLENDLMENEEEQRNNALRAQHELLKIRVQKWRDLCDDVLKQRDDGEQADKMDLDPFHRTGQNIDEL